MAKSPTTHKFRGVIMPTSAHPDIRKAKRNGAQPSIHGTKLWKSSCLLIDYLKRNPPEHAGTVLDVGCGWGIAGIWCAQRYDARVTSADADPDVFPFLDVVADLNKVATEPLVTRFEKISKKQLSNYDMLIAADICFWDELVNPVYNLVNRAVKAGVKKILIADPGRPTFQEMAERCVDRHCAEIVDWSTRRGVKASGAIMVLENA